MSLTDNTLSDLKSFFIEKKHNPTSAMWIAIEDIARTLEKMADGKLAKDNFYVSSLDPGVGKTQTIVCFIRNLLASGSHKDVAVIVCVSRWEEIKNLVASLGLSKDQVSVFTSDEETNALGTLNHQEARVLFTTQQMVDSRLKNGKTFESVGHFHYKQKPRQVRIWDEAMLPGKEITLTVNQIMTLPNIAEKFDKRLSADIRAIAVDLEKAENGSIYQVPNLDTYEAVFKLLSMVVETGSRRASDIAEQLFALSNKKVTISKDLDGNTLLDYVEHLSNDFAPVLILDASARVRKTYDFWANGRGNLLKLAEAGKRYDNLRIHVWNTGGGKSSFRDENKQRQLIEGIAATVNSKPDEAWLVIVHKDDSYKIKDLREAIGSLVVGDASRVKFLTWGNAHATNDYVAVSNIILAGTLFYPRSVIEVRARMSKGLKTEEPLSDDDYDDLEQGEHAHLILQAVCRGTVRRCEGNSCGSCDAYIIAADSTGIKDNLPKVFPFCKIDEWQPVEKPLKGKVKEAFEALIDNLPIPGARMSMSEHMKACGFVNRANYNKTIRKHPDFIKALEDNDIKEVSLGRYDTHYQLTF